MAGWNFFLNGTEVEEPIGWDAIEFTAIRMESHGIDQPFSTEVKFYDKGAKLIKALYDQYFINAEISIQITSDVGYNGEPYVFEGMLNLAIYEEHNVCDTDTWEITVGIIDDNFREQFKARMDVDIDLNATKDLNGNEIDALTWRNTRLHIQDLFLIGNGKNLKASEVTFAYNNPAVVPIYWNKSDFKGSYGSTFDVNNTLINAWGQSPIFVNNGSIARTFTYTIDVNVDLTNMNASNPYKMFITLGVVSGSTLMSFQNLYTTASLPPFNTEHVEFTYTYTVTLQPGEKLNYVIEGELQGSAGGYKAEFALGNTFQIEEINTDSYASIAETLTIEEYLRRCIYLQTGKADGLLSDVFSEEGNGCYWNSALTNGVRIRQAQASNELNPYKTSFKIIFEGLDRILCLGWAFEWTGTEWKIRIEPREYFYQNSISQTFENVGEVTTMAKVDLLANSIQLGYDDKWKNIALSGSYAIHTDRNYFVANRALNENSSAKLDIRSNIIGEGYAIEFSRRLQAVKDDSGSSDRPNDYENFIIWLNRYELTIEDVELTCYKLPNQTGTVVFAPGTVSLTSNLINYSNSVVGNLYNIFHTPARIALRWWKVLGMHTYGVTNPKLQFQVGEYQTTYSSFISDALEPCQQYCDECTLFENADIDPDFIRPSEAQYLFKPIGVEFTYPQSLCDFLTLSQDEQYRKVRITSGSLDIQGFIMEATNQPEDASGGTTKFTLLQANQLAPTGAAFSDGFDDGYQIG